MVDRQRAGPTFKAFQTGSEANFKLKVQDWAVYAKVPSLAHAVHDQEGFGRLKDLYAYRLRGLTCRESEGTGPHLRGKLGMAETVGVENTIREEGMRVNDGMHNVELS